MISFSQGHNSSQHPPSVCSCPLPPISGGTAVGYWRGRHALRRFHVSRRRNVETVIIWEGACKLQITSRIVAQKSSESLSTSPFLMLHTYERSSCATHTHNNVYLHRQDRLLFQIPTKNWIVRTRWHIDIVRMFDVLVGENTSDRSMPHMKHEDIKSTL